MSYLGLAEEAAPVSKDDPKVSGCDSAPEGLVACYRGDNDTADARGVHNGEWVGTYGYATGKVGAGAFNFNGTSRVDVLNADDLNPANITVDGWVNLSNVDGTFTLIGKGDAYSLQVRDGRVIFSSRNAAGVVETFEGTASIKANTWTHIAATHDGAVRRIYVDGVEAGVSDQKGLFRADVNNLSIGSSLAKGDDFSGQADEVKLFARALSAEEIGKIAGNRPDAPNDIDVYTILPSPISEAGGNFVTITVNREAQDSATAASVNFSPVGGTATSGISCGAGVDYVMNATSVSYIANETGQKQVTIQICDDAVAEGAETATIRATLVSGSPTEWFDENFGTTLDRTFTISDDDAFAISVNGPVNEGGASTTVGSDGTGAAPPAGSGNALTFAVNRGGTSGAISVPFSLAGASGNAARFAVNVANQAADFSVSSSGAGCTLTYTQGDPTGTLNFGAASTTCNIIATAYADDFVETAENVRVTITGPAGSIPNPAFVEGTFNNDDNPWISVAVTGSSSTGPLAGAQYVEEGVPQAEADLTYTFTRGLCAAAVPGTPGGAGNAVCPGGNAAGLTAGQAVNVTWGGTGDYPAPAALTFAGTTTSQNVLVNPTSDIVVEIDETIIADIAAGTGYNVDSNTNGGVPSTPTDIATGFINDDDEDVSVVSSGTPVAEAGAPMTFTLSRTALSNGINEVNGIVPTADQIVVNFTMSGPTATCTNGTDYTVSGPGVSYNPALCTGTVTIAANVLTAAVTVDPTDDNVPENNETLTFTINANGTQYGVGSPNATSTNASAQGVILNDDFQVIVRASANVNEGNEPPAGDEGGTITYTFTRIGANAGAITANFNASGAASAFTGGGNTQDYTATGHVTFVPTGVDDGAGTILIPAGAGTPEGGIEANQALWVVTPTDDNTVEPNEDIIVQVDNGAGYAPGFPAQATAFIVNDDAVVVTVAVAPAAVAEDGATNLVYTFTRSEANGDLTVNYTTSGTADNADYTGTVVANNNQVFFTGASLTATVTVDPTADTAVEPDETVIITINPGTGYTAGLANSATGTINNDDASITCALAPTTVVENGAPNLVYTCTRTGVIASALTIPFTLTGSTAAFGTDYVLTGADAGVNSTGGNLTFTAGSATATLTADPTPDTDVEGDETVVVNFSPATGVSGGTSFTVNAPTTLTGTITSDDNTVTVAVSPASIGENAAGVMTYTFTRATGGAAATQPITVNFTTTGSATSGTDYVQSATGSVVIPANQTTATVTVDPTPDGDVEPDETVILTVVAGTNYIVGSPASATGTITNDDTTYTIEFVGITGANSGAGREGNPGDTAPDTLATFRIRRNGANSSAGTVTWATVPGSGTATAGPPNTVCQPGQDYTSDGNVIAFTAGGDDFRDVTVRICRDLAVELTETFDAALSNPTGGVLGTPSVATATILDDDAFPVLTVGDISVNENAGTVTVTVTQSFATGLNTSFSFNTGAVGDTATANVDYSATTGSGSIPAGSTTATITIPIIDDNLDEPNETFTVTITSATNASITASGSDPVGVVTITDNESSTTFAVSDVRQIEGNDTSVDPSIASTSAFNFRITRTGDAQADEWVCFQTVNGDIENPAINPNAATAGPNLGAAGGYPNDYNPLLPGASNCVRFFQGGPSVITVPVIVYGDPVFENDESFTFQLLTIGSTATNGTAGGARFTDALGLGLIQNDDGVVAFSIAQTTTFAGFGANEVPEGNTNGAGTGPQTTTVTYTVTRPTGATPASVDVTVAGVSGLTGATFGTSCGALNSGTDVSRSPATATLSFPVGTTSQTFSVTVCGDTADELNEAYTVSLSNASGGIVGAGGSVTTTIIDDDATPFLTITDVTVCEPNTGTAAAVFTLTRNGLSFLTSNVVVNTVDGTAEDNVPATSTNANDDDYVGIVNQVVTFAPGETTKTVSVTVNGDLIFETDETFTLQASLPSAPPLPSPAPAANITVDPAFGADPIGGGIIANNCADGDPAPTIAVGPVTQVEGTTNPVSPAPFFFRVTRTGATQVPGTFTFATTSGGTATGGASCGGSVDFINTSVTVNFPAGGFSSMTTGGVFGGAQGPNFVDVPVQVCQDATFEPNETFNVTVSGGTFVQFSPTGTTAVGTITNDDGLAFVIRNPGPEGAEGNTGQTTNFNFTIDRIGDSTVASTVCYQTIAGTATAGVDFTPITGTTTCSTFNSSVMSVTVSVPVIGDNVFEADETFFLRLISATQGTIPTVGSDDRLATINNDDPNTGGGGKEGDVVDAAGTPAGDGVLLANDISVLRQFVLGTATPANASQFQRADINGTCGDGAINAADVTVARQWLLNSTPLPDACGPTVPAIVNPLDESNRPEAVGRIIRAVNTQGAAIPNQTIVVQIQLDSQGDEASLSHTINWNPAAFNFVSAVAGPLPTGTVLNTNTAQTAQGRLGVLIDGTNTFANGTRGILTLTLTTTAGATAGTYPVTFSSTPTPQSVSSANGTLLQTTYEAGNIVLTTTAAGVRVSGRVTTAGGQGLRNATVVLTDSEGNRRVATTGSFGIYTFEDVEVGQTYVVGVSARRYRFTSRIVNVTDSLTDVNFVGQE